MKKPVLKISILTICVLILSTLVACFIFLYNQGVLEGVYKTNSELLSSFHYEIHALDTDHITIERYQEICENALQTIAKYNHDLDANFIKQNESGVCLNYFTAAKQLSEILEFKNTLLRAISLGLLAEVIFLLVMMNLKYSKINLFIGYFFFLFINIIIFAVNEVTTGHSTFIKGFITFFNGYPIERIVFTTLVFMFTIYLNKNVHKKIQKSLEK